MTTFDPEKAHREVINGLNDLKSIFETLTIVTALRAGIPSSKLPKVLHMSQTKISGISKYIKERRSASEERQKKS